MSQISKNKKVIYTALFGERGKIIEPKVLPEGWDFVCFTDRHDLKSSAWDVRIIEVRYPDNPRKSAKLPKILPHAYLPEYEVSLWIDANLELVGDPSVLVDTYLNEMSFASFSHSENKGDSRDCVYDELKELLHMNASGRNRDKNEVMIAQIEKYRKEGYPEHKGLIVGMFLLRRHDDPVLKKTMEEWWQEVDNGSIRDQLSCNYVCWKNNILISYIPGDSRHNKFVRYTPHIDRSFSYRILIKIKAIFS